MNDCSIKVCLLGWWGAFPQAGEACCSVLAETAEGRLLLDCGCGSLSRFFKYAGAEDLEGVLLSHFHFDHFSDLECLLYAVGNKLRMGLRREKLRVYAPASPEPLRAVIEYPAFSMTETLREGMEFTMAGMNITVMKVDHPVECYAFRLERQGKVLVYFTDTAYLPGSADFIRAADLLICEATMSSGSRHSTGLGHMSDREAGVTAREGGAKRLCLFHLPSDGDPAYMRRQAALEFGGEVQTPDRRQVF
ncbi:MAG: MBL fold metallo-hydrolase, partial [Treponema sp.]|nr:MBL fold metallo-hydrolase [Treponema sp.]